MLSPPVEHIGTRVNILSYKRKKCFARRSTTVFKVHYFFYYRQVNLHFSETNLLEENASYIDLYIATGINALRRGASRKLSIKTLRSAISLHPHYSIVTIARLRQLVSGRSAATAWRIEGVARGINSCINYHEDLSPLLLDIHHIRDAYIIPRDRYRGELHFQAVLRFHMQKPSGKKKTKHKSHSYKFYRW